MVLLRNSDLDSSRSLRLFYRPDVREMAMGANESFQASGSKAGGTSF